MPTLMECRSVKLFCACTFNLFHLLFVVVVVVAVVLCCCGGGSVMVLLIFFERVGYSSSCWSVW